MTRAVNRSRARKRTAMRASPSPQWLHDDELAPLRRLNDQALELLREQAAIADDPRIALAAPKGLQARFAQLPPAARVRIAREPFLLVDLNFANLGFWRDALARMDARTRVPSRLPARFRGRLIGLARASATLAWTYARGVAAPAQVIIGLSPGVARLLASVSPLEIERCAESHAHELTLRWVDSALLWERLLDGDAAGLRRARLHGLQLTSAAVLAGAR